VTPYAGTTRYGMELSPSASLPTNATSALGAPDGRYATFVSGQSLRLLLGVWPVQNGRLTIYHAKGGSACEISVIDENTVSWDLGGNNNRCHHQRIQHSRQDPHGGY